MGYAMVELVLDEGKWLFASMLLSTIVVLVSLGQRHARSLRLRPHLAADGEIRGEVSASVRAGGGAPAPVKKTYRVEILRAMNLFYGCMIGTMGSGHLLAVTVRMVQGTLTGSWLVLYPLGLVLAVPAWWLAFGVARYVMEEDRYRNRIVALNAWLGVCLLGLGLHNFPLAAPAALNIAYQLHTRRAVGWTIVTVAIAANLALFAGSVMFLATGQSFEQFQGIE